MRSFQVEIWNKMATTDDGCRIDEAEGLFVAVVVWHKCHPVKLPYRCKRGDRSVMFEPPNLQKLVGLWVSVGPGQDGRMVDPENPSKRPRVWTLLLGVINENISFIKGDMDDILTLLKVIGDKVDPHD